MGLRITFQRDQAEGLNATYHFTFTGEESCQATVTIRDKEIQVKEGLVGTADLRITADNRAWLGFLAKERNLLWALVRRKIRIKGALLKFGVLAFNLLQSISFKLSSN